MKEFKVEIPEGYEIDKEKSTFEKIVFKKKEEVVNCWEDIGTISGKWIGVGSDFCDYGTNPFVEERACDSNKNVFLNKKYAKSALALAQISQLLPYYDSKVDWNRAEKNTVFVGEKTLSLLKSGSYFTILWLLTHEKKQSVFLNTMNN